ncbi:hypothetical protein P7C70_g6316, partial [Phenoliferia sp. Uapishka_3]
MFKRSSLREVEFIGLLNLGLRASLDTLVNSKISLQLESLSLTTVIPHQSANPRPNSLTSAYLASRLYHFPNLEHLSLEGIVSKPCDWTIPTYRLQSLTITSSPLNLDCFRALLGASTTGKSLRILRLIGDQKSPLQVFLNALESNTDWLEELQHLQIEITPGLPYPWDFLKAPPLPPTALAKIYRLQKLEVFEYEGPVEAILEDIVDPKKRPQKVWVGGMRERIDVALAVLEEGLRKACRDGSRLETEGNGYRLFFPQSL